MANAGLSRRRFIGGGLAAATGLLAEQTFGRLPVARSQVATDPTDLTISEANGLLRSGALSPVELVRAYLDRIARFDPQLRAYITVTEERAVARATELERELGSGRWRGPLHGIPIGLKDNIDTEGVLTTAGSAVFQDRVPTEDAEVVRRLDAAGAVILGKLNLHEFAYGATSTINHHGPVANPWDMERIPGGSSGGSGAAVSARLCAGALGTDTGGSIRIPASYCGIVGFKPTHGLASIRGIIPFGPSFDHVGPMCRTVSDTALMLQALAGYDALDPVSIQADIPIYSSATTRSTAHLRLGVPRSPFYESLDPQIERAMEAAMEVLSTLTAGAKDVQLPPVPEVPLAVVEAYGFHLDYLETRRELYQPETLRRIEQGASFTTAAYVEGRSQLILARRAIRQVFEDVDLLVTPTMASLPITIAAARQGPDDSGRIRNTLPFNIYGIPSVSVPCGFTREGLPIGIQISGAPLGELDVLSLAFAFEQAAGWRDRAPPLRN